MQEIINSLDEKLSPLTGEAPSEYAERMGVYYTSLVAGKHKKQFGQFFTPISIAHFMSSFCSYDRYRIKILDPGCGIGILSTSLAERLVNSCSKIKIIELVAFETDINILPLAEKCYKYLGEWLNKRDISFNFFLCKNDFILHNSVVLSNQDCTNESYDIIISNPPYFKLPKNDVRAIASKQVIYGQTNIYSIFLLIASKLLSSEGKLIFITPRSFCSGNYFRLFRELFFSTMKLEKIHLFNSRKDAFKRDKVLQENIIITAKRNNPVIQNTSKFPNYELIISYSDGVLDISESRVKHYKISDLLNFNSFQKILHLPTSELDEKIIQIFKNWNGSLASYKFEISTGPVVDFRSEIMIKFEKNNRTVPLIWLHNIEPMKVVWPIKNNFRGKPKGQYILNNANSLSRLIKNRNYVLIRRFSAKDDIRRLIAAPYFSNMTNSSMIGVENHLNYIYAKDKELTIDQAFGISGLLNSRLFDLYFRTFNGNINVSATELRDFPLPNLKLIENFGQKLRLINKNELVLDIDSLLLEVLNLKIDLNQIYGR